MLRWYLISVSLIWTLALSGQGDDHRDFLPPYNFQVDSVSLLATWESPKIILLNEDFEGDAFPPVGWTATSLGVGWLGVDSPEYDYWIVPEHPGGFALANDDAAFISGDGSIDYLVTPVMDLTVADNFQLFFDSYFDGGYGQRASLEYSLDSGATWQLLLQLDADLEWKHLEVDLSSFSGQEGESVFQLAFHADDYGFWASGWAIDNVVLYSSQNPQEVTGYKVFLDDMFIEQVNTTIYQFYCMYYTYHTFKVYACYQDGMSEPVQQDLISYYLTKPDSLTGYAPDNAAILEWYPPLEYHPALQKQSNNSKQPDQLISTGIHNIGDVILSWPVPSPISSCFGICDDGYNLWITDANGSATTIYEVTYEGVNTGITITVSLGQSWIGDMVSDGEFLYACLVGGPNSIVKVDLATGETVETITGAFTVAPQRGLAADFENQEFYIGGPESDQIWRTDFTGATISTFGFTGVSGLSWHPAGGPDGLGSLWVVETSAYDRVTEIDPNNSWATIQSFAIPGGIGYSGAGAEIKRSDPDCGALWIPNISNNTIYLVDLQEPWSPPEGLWTIPFNLIGFNVYRSGRFIAYVQYTVPDSCYYIDPIDFSDSSYYNYDVTALYDLNAYGFPADTGESLPDETEVTSCCWNELDFFEDWDLSSHNYWKFSNHNWTIDPDLGNEAPGAVFRPDSVLYLYEQSLETWQIMAWGISVNVSLEYDLSLSSINSSGEEKLVAEVYDYMNNSWNTVKTHSNLEGSFTWRRDTINITNNFNDQHFKVRFRAVGANSSDIQYWAVDNIAITRDCLKPENVVAELKTPSSDTVLVSWDEPVPQLGEWWQWDDGNHSSSIGFATTKNQWAACAIRWTPEQLADLKGASLTAIGFIPGDVTAFYKIAAWKNDGILPFYIQAAGNLRQDEWNIIPLEVPIPVDITKNLLVGYQFAGNDSYAISLDNGPSVDGYGNMIYRGGYYWETLMEIIGYDYNINLKAYFERDGVPVENYQLFRSIDGSEPVMIAEPEEPGYTDPAGLVNEMYCYKLKSVFPDGCESDFSDEACVVFTSSDPVELKNEGSFRIFPNPSCCSVSIESSENIEFISLYNPFGELMLKQKVDERQLEIPVSDYPAGVYMIRVETGGRVISKKVMVVH